MLMFTRDEKDKWMRRAACADVDTRQFFDAEDETDEQTMERYEDAILGFCAGCPVENACLSYSVTNDLQEGIWGGMTPEQRKSLLSSLNRDANKRGIPKIIPHGYNGYYSYKCRCDICVAAHHAWAFDGRTPPPRKPEPEEPEIDPDLLVYDDDGNVFVHHDGTPILIDEWDNYVQANGVPFLIEEFDNYVRAS